MEYLQTKHDDKTILSYRMKVGTLLRPYSKADQDQRENIKLPYIFFTEDTE